MYTLKGARVTTRTHKHAHTNQHVLLITFPHQQWFRKLASILRYTYIACIVKYYICPICRHFSICVYPLLLYLCYIFMFTYWLVCVCVRMCVCVHIMFRSFLCLEPFILNNVNVHQLCRVSVSTTSPEWGILTLDGQQLHVLV
jgi:hypothetical protein